MENIAHFAQQHWNQSFQKVKALRNGEKIIYVLVDKLGVSYVLKGEKASAQSVEGNCQFANELRACLPTPTYYKSIHNTFTVQHGAHVFTLVEFLEKGEEIQTLTNFHLKEIATKLAVMHRYTLTNDKTLKKATSWSMFGGNTTDDIGDYDENELSFQIFEQTFHKPAQFSEHKRKVYGEKRFSLSCLAFAPKSGDTGGLLLLQYAFSRG